MKYEVNIDNFEGPLDLLLHLIKESDVDIKDISIDTITKQYLDYIERMEQLNLNIASEYLVMATELLVIKSSYLLPKSEVENDEEEYVDPKEELINRLVEYEKYKNATDTFKELEFIRKNVYTREPSNLVNYNLDEEVDYGVNLDDLLNAFSSFLESKEFEKPLNTKIVNKDYSINKRCLEIKKLLKSKKKIKFNELFKEYNKEYIVITFLSILSMCRKNEIVLEQESNFNTIIIKGNGE